MRNYERSAIAGGKALAHGVTSFHDAGVDFATIDFYKEMEAAEELPIRLNVMVRGRSNAELAENLAAYRMVAQDNDFLTVRSSNGRWMGRLGPQGWLLAPYADLPSTAGLVHAPIEEIMRTARLFIEHGYQLNTMPLAIAPIAKYWICMNGLSPSPGFLGPKVAH